MYNAHNSRAIKNLVTLLIYCKIILFLIVSVGFVKINVYDSNSKLLETYKLEYKSKSY